MKQENFVESNSEHEEIVGDESEGISTDIADEVIPKVDEETTVDEELDIVEPQVEEEDDEERGESSPGDQRAILGNADRGIVDAGLGAGGWVFIVPPGLGQAHGRGACCRGDCCSSPNGSHTP